MEFESRPEEEDTPAQRIAVPDLVPQGGYGRRAAGVASALAECIEVYIRRCATAVGQEPPSASYLRLIPHTLPAKQIVVGQEPYATSILPRYAAAMAYDYSACNAWTPTLQVVAQAMALTFGGDVTTYLKVVAMGYLLLPSGIILINAHPYSRLTDHRKIQTSSYTAELVSSLALASRLSGARLVTIVELGDEATMTCDAAWSSMRSIRSNMRRLSVSNPVRVSRQKNARGSGLGPAPGASYVRLARALGHTLFGSGLLAPVPTSPWVDYTPADVSVLRPRDTLRLMADAATSQSIVQLVVRFRRVVNRCSAMQYSGQAPRRGPRKGADEDEMSYTARVMTEINERSVRLSDDATEAIASLREHLSAAAPGDADAARSLIRSLRDCVTAMSMAAAFFSSVPGLLTNTTSAVGLSTNTIPPIVGVAEHHDPAPLRMLPPGRHPQGAARGPSSAPATQGSKAPLFGARRAPSSGHDTLGSGSQSAIPVASGSGGAATALSDPGLSGSVTAPSVGGMEQYDEFSDVGGSDIPDQEFPSLAPRAARLAGLTLHSLRRETPAFGGAERAGPGGVRVAGSESSTSIASTAHSPSPRGSGDPFEDVGASPARGTASPLGSGAPRPAGSCASPEPRTSAPSSPATTPSRTTARGRGLGPMFGSSSRRRSGR